MCTCWDCFGWKIKFFFVSESGASFNFSRESFCAFFFLLRSSDMSIEKFSTFFLLLCKRGCSARRVEGWSMNFSRLNSIWMFLNRNIIHFFTSWIYQFCQLLSFFFLSFSINQTSATARERKPSSWIGDGRKGKGRACSN